MMIKPSHKGLFTKKAHAAGKGVQEYANEEAGAGGELGKEANFARMAKRHFEPLPKNKKKKKSKGHYRDMAKKVMPPPMAGGDADDQGPGGIGGGY